MNKIMDIVNNKIDVTKDTIIFYNLLLEKLDKEETAYKMSKANFEESQEELKFLIKIKKHLEILEILKNHLAFMGENKTSLKLINNGCATKNCELYKVKQWLEELMNINGGK